MTYDLQRQAGWATPLAPAFDSASLARRLGHVDDDACLAQKQGRCPGKDGCADCAWSEDTQPTF
jgi:hypothetical protein